MANINVDATDTRIAKLRTWLFTIVDTLLTSTDYQINGNMLSNDPINYSLDKIPMASTIEKWVNGHEVRRDVYSFRSRNNYSQDVMSNLQNVGFFEKFEDLIYTKNKNKELPLIDNITSIECLNCGTMNSAETETAEFDIQIQVTYEK